MAKKKIRKERINPIAQSYFLMFLVCATLAVFSTIVVVVAHLWITYQVTSEPVPQPAQQRPVEGVLASFEVKGMQREHDVFYWRLFLEGDPATYLAFRMSVELTGTPQQQFGEVLSTMVGRPVRLWVSRYADQDASEAYRLEMGGQTYISQEASERIVAESEEFLAQVRSIGLVVLLVLLVLTGGFLTAFRRRR